MRFSEIRQNLKRDFSGFPGVRLALLGDTPTQFLHQALMGCGYDRAIHPIVYEAGIDQIDAQVFEPSSGLHAFRPDYVVLFQSTQRLLSRFYALEAEEQAGFASAHLDAVKSLCETLDRRLRANIVWCNFPEIDDGVYGSYANKTPLSFPYQVRSINLGLMTLAASTTNLFIADLSSLQNLAGRRTAFSTRTYASTGFVYALDSWAEVATRILDIVQSIRGRVHKAVILDLDNTLWGGVLGDDGMENIQIGDLGIGKTFSEFQAWLKQLRRRGIILAVCSKNYEHVAREVFERHPDMVLRLDDIAVFVANWDNKVDNIRHIQSVLNVGFDTMVYLDDSPFEREMVKGALPGLTVPDLPDDPADYLEALRSLNLFETAAVTAGDGARTRQYQEESRRTGLRKTYDSEDAFLASLEMVGAARACDGFLVPRVAQLSQRSNQFNLRTVRYSERDVERIMADPGHVIRCFTLEDTIGQYGLVSVVVLEKRQGSLFIENWFMSCRVLKRGMEPFVLNAIMEAALEQGYRTIAGEYLPTGKNELVRDHYANLGFSARQGLWVMDAEGYTVRHTHIRRVP